MTDMRDLGSCIICRHSNKAHAFLGYLGTPTACRATVHMPEGIYGEAPYDFACQCTEYAKPGASC